MRLVLDTNVVASALLWSGPPRQLLQAARNHEVELLTSMPLLAELTDILGRPKFDRKILAAALSIDQMVDRYAELSTIVHALPTPRIAPDPDDDVVVGTALAAQAGIIVTGDRSLLGMRRHQGIDILAVQETLSRIAAMRAN